MKGQFFRFHIFQTGPFQVHKASILYSCTVKNLNIENGIQENAGVTLSALKTPKIYVMLRFSYRRKRFFYGPGLARRLKFLRLMICKVPVFGTLRREAKKVAWMTLWTTFSDGMLEEYVRSHPQYSSHIRDGY